MLKVSASEQQVESQKSQADQDRRKERTTEKNQATPANSNNDHGIKPN
jgi:hypothetical protein